VVNVTKRYGLTIGERDRVMYNFIGSGKSNRWNLANAITATAKESNEPDRQYDLEQYGWEIMTLPQSEWQVLTADDRVNTDLALAH
jgi:hypothetical protein